MRIWFALGTSVALIFVALAQWQGARAQEAAKPTGGCAGLHAGIAARFIQPTQEYPEAEAYVQASLTLLNDSETTLDTAWDSWTLVIDGNELKDSAFRFHNGPVPVGGYGTLAAGANFSFAKNLPIDTYFPERREYKISWKGKYFQSPTATVTIPAVER
jgi:hypothetical protein